MYRQQQVPWWPHMEVGVSAKFLQYFNTLYMFVSLHRKTHRNERATTWWPSSNGSIFRATGPLCGEFIGHRWIPLTKASDADLWCFLWSVPWINGWVNNREAGDLRRCRAHYDVIVMKIAKLLEDFVTKNNKHFSESRWMTKCSCTLMSGIEITANCLDTLAIY